MGGLNCLGNTRSFPLSGKQASFLFYVSACDSWPLSPFATLHVTWGTQESHSRCPDGPTEDRAVALPSCSQCPSHSHSMLPILADYSQTHEVGHEGTEVSREQSFQARGCVPRLVSVSGSSSSNWRTVCVFVLWVMNPSEDPSLGPMAW